MTTIHNPQATSSGDGPNEWACHVFFETYPKPMWLYSPESLAVLAVNEAALAHYGYSRAEFLALTQADILAAGETVPPVSNSQSWQPAIRQQHRLKDNTLIAVELITRMADFMGQPAVLVSMQDVTQYVQTENRLRRLNRVYAVLGDVNQAIVRERQLPVLFDTICRIAVEKGRFRMAWLGLVDELTGEVKAVAAAGATNGYPDNLQIRLDDSPQGQGPTANALRNGQPVICNDIEHDPHMAPWREAALQLGYRSSGAFPLVSGKTVRGTINLYATEVGFFDAEELKLLNEMAMNVSFAIEFAERAEHLYFQRNLLASVQDAVVGTDLQYRIRYWSGSAQALYGWTAEEVLGQPWQDIVQNKFLPDTNRQDVLQQIDRQGHWTGELTQHRRDGSEFPVMVVVSLIRDSQGRPGGYVAVTHDITNRKQADATLRQSEAKFRALVEQSLTGIYVFRKDHFLYVNQRFCQIFGYTEEEVLASLHPTDVIVQDDKAVASENIRRRIDGEVDSVHYTARGLRKDGTTIWIEIHGSRLILDGVPAVTGTVLDITGRKQAEEALRESELRFRTAFNYSASGLCLTGINGKFLKVNRAMCTMFGYSEHEFQQMHFNDITHPDDFEIGREIAAEMIAGDVPSIDFEKRYLRKTGELLWAHVNSALLRDGSGQPLHFITQIENITERKQAEVALRVTQLRLQQAVSAGNVGLWDWDLRNNQVYFSPEWKRQIGYTDDEISNTFDEWQRRIHPDDLSASLETVQAFIANPWPNYQLEFRLRHKDGSYRTILALASLLFDDAGQPIRMLGSHMDITELRQLEAEKDALAAQFYQTQKVESVGRLASGIAHDFNNLLVPIIGYAELGLMHALPNSTPYHQFSHIKAAGDRAKDLTRQLLAFSRHQVLKLETVNLNRLVSDFEVMLQRLVREDIEFKVRLAPEVDPVQADAGQIEQVLLNLVINASDAMPNGGILSVETANVELDDAYAAEHSGSQSGPHVMLAVTDTGHGIDDEIQDRIFEPFFTTKERSKGTGLGLSTVFGIIKQHGGNIWFYSEPGRGSTFKIYLPASDHSVAAAAPSEADLSDQLTGTETLLLVEDDASVRLIVSDALQMHGYRLLMASDPDQAMVLMDGQIEPVQLLLTDVILPRINGLELYRQLALKNPDLKVIYMSGYTDDAINDFHELEKGAVFLQKPFSIRVLLQKVRAVLG